MRDNSTFEVAWKYHTLKRCVIPSGGGTDGKVALEAWTPYQSTRPTDSELEEWQLARNPKIWAMVCGPVSGLFTVDCDNEEAVEMMEATGLKPHVKTTKGSHYYVQWSSMMVKSSTRILPGLDIKGQGGYVNFCGNNGKATYDVLITPTDDTLYTFEQLPKALQDALRQKASEDTQVGEALPDAPKPKVQRPNKAADRVLAKALSKAQPGNRNDTGLWLACQLRDNGLSLAEAETVVLRYVSQVKNAGAEPYTESEAVASLKQAYTRPARESLSIDTTLPEIIIDNMHLRHITADALNFLYRANKPERIFRRSGRLVRITIDEKERPVIDLLTESAFRGYLARSCNFMRITKHGKRPIPPPLDVVRDCLSLADWEFPPLLGIVESPVIRPDGSILSTTGYDHATALYYRPVLGLSVPPIPDCPTDSDLQAAVKLVLEVICDFPFDSDASRANALAALFTPILRPMIKGPVPLVIIDKPQSGTGASLLAEAISYITTGRPAAMMTAQKDDEGWRKAIFSLLLQGQMMVTIDNIEGALSTPSLAATLTATDFQDRILGRSEMVILPNRTTWVATGNNIRLGGDLPRRCIWVRMDARMPRPWLRDSNDFKHPRLISWVSKNRGFILAAILTIARGWVAAGRADAAGLPSLGGFEDYTKIIGGTLASAGVFGFLGNLNRMYDEADVEALQWQGFFEVWLEFAGEDPMSVAGIISLLADNEDFRNSLPDSLANRDAREYSRRLGKALSRQDGAHHMNGLMLKKAGKKRRGILWQVVSYENANSHPFSFKCELGEFQSPPTFIEKKKEKRVYIEWGEANSPNSPSDMKRCELAPPNSPSAPKTDKTSSNIPQSSRMAIKPALTSGDGFVDNEPVSEEWDGLEKELDAFLEDGEV